MVNGCLWYRHSVICNIRNTWKKKIVSFRCFFFLLFNSNEYTNYLWLRKHSKGQRNVSICLFCVYVWVRKSGIIFVLYHHEYPYMYIIHFSYNVSITVILLNETMELFVPCKDKATFLTRKPAHSHMCWIFNVFSLTWMALKFDVNIKAHAILWLCCKFYAVSVQIERTKIVN